MLQHPRRPRRSGLTRLACAVLAAALSAASPVHAADPPSTTHKEQVLALYNLGKELLDAGRTAEACAAFEQGRRLDPTAINLLLRLGDCYAKIGRTASAWNVFGEAAAVARSAGDPRAARAAELAEELSPKLSRLTLAVAAQGAPAGLEVRRNGVLVPPAQWGQPMPVDPGAYTIEAKAPGKARWVALQEVGAAERVVVDVPALADDRERPGGAPAPALAPLAPQPAADARPGDGATQRILALVSGGVGLAGLGVGTAFGLHAISQRNEADRDHCDPQNRCDTEGISLRDGAQEAAAASTIAFAAGAGALAAGAILWLTAPSPALRADARRDGPPSAQAFAVVGPSGGAIFLRGSY